MRILERVERAPALRLLDASPGARGRRRAACLLWRAARLDTARES